MRKRVLLVTNFCPPVLNAESILVWKTVCELRKAHDITILTTEAAPSGGSDANLSLPEEIRVLRTPGWKPHGAKGRKITEKLLGTVVDEHFPWALVSGSKLSDLQDCDVIYSRSQPGASHVLALRLKKSLGKPWIAQFSDPWANNPYHDHTKLRHAVDKYFERRVVEQADLVVFPTEEVLQMYHRNYAELSIRDKAVVLPHHFAPDLYGSIDQTDILQRPETTSFTYFGDFYGLRSPSPFLSALRLISETRPGTLTHIRVGFLGNVATKFSEMLAQAPIPVGRGKLSYFESLKAMAQSDVLLLIDAPSPDGVNPFLPSKLIDYLGAGRPILGITDVRGSAADILRRHGHTVVSPHDIQGIANAVVRMVTHRPEAVVPPAEFTSAAVVGRLAELMERAKLTIPCQ